PQHGRRGLPPGTRAVVDRRGRSRPPPPRRSRQRRQPPRPGLHQGPEPMKGIRGAFSLIEILVAVAILAVLAGMTFLTTGHQQRGAVVRQEAAILAATLRRARGLALAHRATYAVVFNLQNAPGSSGAVLNTRSGGHWSRLLGPKPSG